MRVFFDSSAFAKRYLNEPGSEDVDILLQKTSELALSMIAIPEIISALTRLRYENKISLTQYRSAKNVFFSDLKDVILCTLTPKIIDKSVDIIEHNRIRGMDSLHVASALEWQAELFVSSDQRQIIAAKQVRLKTIAV